MASQHDRGEMAPAIRRPLLLLLVGAAILSCGAMIWRVHRALTVRAEASVLARIDPVGRASQAERDLPSSLRGARSPSSAATPVQQDGSLRGVR